MHFVYDAIRRTECDAIHLQPHFSWRSRRSGPSIFTSEDAHPTSFPSSVHCIVAIAFRYADQIPDACRQNKHSRKKSKNKHLRFLNRSSSILALDTYFDDCDTSTCAGRLWWFCFVLSTWLSAFFCIVHVNDSIRSAAQKNARDVLFPFQLLFFYTQY